jgi:hypothetical protein
VQAHCFPPDYIPCCKCLTFAIRLLTLTTPVCPFLNWVRTRLTGTHRSVSVAHLINSAWAVIISRGQYLGNLSASKSALRTVRDSFPSHGSPLFRHNIYVYMLPLLCLTFTSLTLKRGRFTASLIDV